MNLDVKKLLVNVKDDNKILAYFFLNLNSLFIILIELNFPSAWNLREKFK